MKSKTQMSSPGGPLAAAVGSVHESRRSEVREALESLALFRDLDERALDGLVGDLSVESVAPRTRIYSVDDPCGPLYLLVSGAVRLAKISSQGREITLSLVAAGGLFGDQRLAGAERRGQIAEALTAATLVRIDGDVWRDWTSRHPVVLARLLALAAERQLDTEARIEEIAFGDVPTRVARLLARLAARYGAPARGGVLIELPLTHQEVANLIGATRETTTAILNDLRRRGLLELGRKRIVVVDPERLADLGETTPRDKATGLPRSIVH